MLVFVILLFFMTAPTHHHSTSYNLAKVNHPVPMPGADREDAIRIVVTRDGQAFFGTERASPADLPEDSRSPERSQHGAEGLYHCRHAGKMGIDKACS